MDATVTDPMMDAALNGGSAMAAAPGTAAGVDAATAARIARAATVGRFLGRATRFGARFAGPALAAAPLAGFGDYRLNDPGVDSSLGGTMNNLVAGRFAPAWAGLQKGAVEAGLDTVSGLAKTADVLIPGQHNFAGRFHQMVQSDLGPMLEPGPAPLAPLAPPPPAATPRGFGARPASQGQVRATEGEGGPMPGYGQPTAMTAADIMGSQIPRLGTGAIMDSQGRVINIDSRSNPAVAEAAPENWMQTVARGFAAVPQLRAIQQAEANKRAMDLEQLRYGATSENAALRSEAAREYYRRTGDAKGMGAVAAGRLLPEDQFNTMPSTSGNDVIVTNKRTGASEIQTPTRYATETNITASMKARGLTRAQALDAYQKQGFDVSRLKK